MAREISSSTAKMSVASRSYLPDQRWNPVLASTSWAVMRTRLPSRCTLPSSTCATRSRRATSLTGRLWPLNAKAELRAGTSTPGSWPTALRISSLIPSLKYSLAVSRLRLVNGSTATDSAASVADGPAAPAARRCATMYAPAAIAAATSRPSATRSRMREPPASAGVPAEVYAAVAVPGVAAASSTGISSSAVCGRSAGCLARSRMTRSASGAGSDRCFVTGSGAWVTCAASTCCGVAPVNGGRPASIS